MVSIHKDTVDGPVHHSSHRTKLSTWLPWKQQTKCKLIECTGAKKKARSKAAKTLKWEYNATVQASRNVVYQEAIALQAKFGVHSIEWYYKDLLQVLSKKAPRQVSSWNVFLHEQAKLTNDGMSSHLHELSYCTHHFRAFE